VAVRLEHFAPAVASRDLWVAQVPFEGKAFTLVVFEDGSLYFLLYNIFNFLLLSLQALSQLVAAQSCVLGSFTLGNLFHQAVVDFTKGDPLDDSLDVFATVDVDDLEGCS